MNIKTIPFPNHLVVIINEAGMVTRLKLSPQEVAALDADCSAFLTAQSGACPIPLVQKDLEVL